MVYKATQCIDGLKWIVSYVITWLRKKKFWVDVIEAHARV